MEKNKEYYEKMMRMCLDLAYKGIGCVSPNPLVGAILTDNNGNIISKGFHEKYGENHAEVNCIKNLDIDFSDKTLFVNLEPCSHFGKTPPCVDLIIEKGIKRVVIGIEDVNPKVSGRGILKLKENGIEVITPVLEDECRRLNKIFIKNQTEKMPFVAIKTATTLDSKIASSTNSSKWITDEYSRNKVQKLRYEYDAIMTGSNTVLTDNPYLNVRDENKKNPVRIIIDRNFKTDFSYNVYNNDNAKVILVTNKDVHYKENVEIMPFLDFKTLFSSLYQKGIYSVLIEAGCGLNSAIIKENMADYIYNFVAPKILANGANFVSNIKIDDVNNSIPLVFSHIEKLQNDILIEAYFKK